MSSTDRRLDRLEAMLGDARLEVERVGDMLNCARGSGKLGAKANVDPIPFLESLTDHDDAAAHRRMAGYVSGVKHVLLEPSDSDADQWDFPTAAGKLTMGLEVDSFVDGCADASGNPAWVQPLDGDIVYAFFFELDMGIRVLDEAQFERWTATKDRVVAGARSMLFHKAQTTDPVPLEDHPEVEELRVGDGYDAARCLVLDDLMFGEFDDSTRIAIPTPDDLLFVRDGTGGGVEALRAALRERYDEADYPLSDALFRFERGKPVRTD